MQNKLKKVWWEPLMYRIFTKNKTTKYKIMKNLNPTTEDFTIANYNFCKNNGVFNDRLRILIPLSQEAKAMELLSKFPKYCKVELSMTRTNNDSDSPKCFRLSAQYYNPKNYVIGVRKPNNASEKRRLKILEILEDNNIKSF